MYCARVIVSSKNLTLCFAASYSYLSSVNHFHIESKPETSGFCFVTNNTAI